MPITNRTALPYLVKTNTDADIGRRPAVQQYEKQAGSDGATTNTVYTLTNNYVPGTNTLMVFVNGQKAELIAAPSDETEYAETDSSTVTFGASLVDSDVIEFIVVGTYFIQDTELYIAAVNNPMGRKNLIINGAMQVWQRSTSVASIGNGDNGYHTADRWLYTESDAPGSVITMSQDADVPTGEGFGYSLQVDCTTAEGSVGANEIVRLEYRIEGQDLQHLRYGTSSAKSMTLSFWLKSDTKTGTMCVAFKNHDESYYYVAEITIADNNWNKYTVIVPGDTSNAFGNDNAFSLAVNWILVCGSTYHGTAGSWTASVINATSNQDNFLDSTDNNIFLTGVQLEVNTQATDFEFRSYGEEIALCQRYYAYSDATASGATVFSGNVTNGGSYFAGVDLPVEMRASPTITLTNAFNVSFSTTVGSTTKGTRGFRELRVANASAAGYFLSYWTADAEL